MGFFGGGGEAFRTEVKICSSLQESKLAFNYYNLTKQGRKKKQKETYQLRLDSGLTNPNTTKSYKKVWP